jgi:hypothetical protein
MWAAIADAIASILEIVAWSRWGLRHQPPTNDLKVLGDIDAKPSAAPKV